jgi:HK97 family phage portal protein
MITFQGIKELFSKRGIVSSLLYGTQQIGSTNPIWITDKSYGDLYNSVPELKLVISKKVAMFLNGRINLVRDNGEKVEQHPVLDLIQKPNPIQGRNEFFAQWYLNEQIYGNGFLKALRVSSDVPKAVYVLPSEHMKVVPTGKLFEQIDINDIIDFYEFDNLKIREQYREISNILHTKVYSDGSYFASKSPIEALTKPISNLIGAYKSRNILINDMGAKGILSFGSNSDGQGPLGVGNSHLEVEKQYREKYGINHDQSKVIISKTPVSWTPMSYPIKDLMLLEECHDNFLKIIDSYGLNIHVFSQEKGSTFDNVNQGIKSAYENTIIPEAETKMEQLTKFFKLNEQGLRLVIDFSHMNLWASDTEKLSSRIMSEMDRGLWTPNEARTMMKAMMSENVSLDKNYILNSYQSLDNKEGLLALITELSPLVANNLLDKLTDQELSQLLNRKINEQA